MQFFKRLFQRKELTAFEKQLQDMLGIVPGNIQLYRNALVTDRLKKPLMKIMNG